MFKDILREYGISAIEHLAIAVEKEKYNLKDSGLSREGCIYFARSPGEEIIKIGRTDNIKRRIHQIEKEIGREVELIHSIETDCPPNTEAIFHRALLLNRACGVAGRGREWYDLSEYEHRIFRAIKKLSSISYIGIYCNHQALYRSCYEHLLTTPK
jgi:hypothetical protein